MISVSQIFKTAGKFASDHSPTILSAVAVAGVATTAFYAGKGAFKAKELILAEEVDRLEPLDFKAQVRLTWTCYIPALSVGAATIACVVGANTISSKRAAALASAYSLTESAFKEYQNKVVEKLGEKQHEKVRDEIAKDRIEANPVSKEVIIAGNGDVLCYDSFTGRYFNSSMETLRKAQNDINAEAINNSYASQNDFNRIVGLDILAHGEEVGWRPDNLLDLEFSTQLTDDGRPCLVVSYSTAPIRGYWKGY